MLILVIGGSGSGKSDYAEERILEFGGKKRIYLATMESGTEEGQERIRRHRALRAGKGFVTVECPKHLDRLIIEKDADVLLEDLPNLAANVMFAEDGIYSPGKAGDGRLLSSLQEELSFLRRKARNLVVVTGNIFSDGADYEGGMRIYQKLVADCNRYLAGEADEVIEVVCGLPCFLKG